MIEWLLRRLFLSPLDLATLVLRPELDKRSLGRSFQVVCKLFPPVNKVSLASLARFHRIVFTRRLSVRTHCCHDNAREREARWKTKDSSVSVQLASRRKKSPEVQHKSREKKKSQRVRLECRFLPDTGNAKE